MAGSLSNYEFGKAIGQGSFATVYLASDNRKSKQSVAVKKFFKSNVKFKLLVNEVASLRNLKHINIVALHEQIEDLEYIYIAMEYCNGGNLAQYLQCKGSMSEEHIGLF